MKTSHLPLVSIVLMLSVAVAAPEPARAAELWVSPGGDDRNPGTREQPLASVAMALRKGRELKRLKDPAAADGVRILLRGGTYGLGEPLWLRPEDSGTEAAPTVIAAAPGEHPVLSGGVRLSNWHKLEGNIEELPEAARGKVWVADAPRFNGRVLEFRQLWVGGRKATRAREPDGDEMARLVVWDRAKEEAAIPASLLAGIKPAASVEMQLLQQWEVAMLRLKAWQLEGDRARVTFHAPESRVQFEHPWPQPIMTEGNEGPFFLTGAVAFLDQPGEWCQDLPDGRVLYWPREGEDLTGDPAVVPALETLVRIEGTVDRPVAHVQLRGISFQHAAWTRPSVAGHVPLQAGMYLIEAYKLTPKGTPDWRSLDNQGWVGRMPAGVTVSGAHHTRFERCRFEHMAASGLDYVGATHDGTIEGCVFRDLGGNGLQLGSFQEGPIETHLPYDPADERVVCTRVRIANNLVTDVANEDWGCVGIGVGYAREIAIEHNEVSNVSYTGISLGWGWTRTPNTMRRNRVHANHVHHVATRMADTGGIYTLSAQPGTMITENAVHSVVIGRWVHDPKHWSYIYLDEGSSFMTVRDNWCPEEKFQKNANGPGNTWENNGPMVSPEIKDAAGLEAEFRDLREFAGR
ncbi:MAG TPA: right-handed parallel beta-helix repeat-containing protein [Opitutaceae bacterium]